MGRYAIRRVLQMIPVFFGTTFLLYAIMFALPGDPLRNLSIGKQTNPAYIEYIRTQFHLDQPFIVQYLLYMKGIFTGDFGHTFNGVPVSDIFAQKWPVSLTLALTAFAIEVIFGIGFGIWAALRKGKFFDNLSLTGTLVVVADPRLRPRLRDAVGVRGEAPLGRTGRHPGRLAQELHPPGHRPRQPVAGLCTAAHPTVPAGGVRQRLRENGARQGPARAHGHDAATRCATPSSPS